MPAGVLVVVALQAEGRQVQIVDAVICAVRRWLALLPVTLVDDGRC